jgi:signal transduction histidine kinase
MGLLGMQERALILGGRLEVESTTGGGTTVRAIIPKEQLT